MTITLPSGDRLATLRSLLTPDVTMEAVSDDLSVVSFGSRIPLDNAWDLAIYALSLGIEARAVVPFLTVHIELSRSYPELTTCKA